MVRLFNQYVNDLFIDDILIFDEYFIGFSRIRFSDLLVIDLVAGVIVFVCVLKSYNGVIGVDSYYRFCGIVFEAVKLVGYFIGFVVTIRIIDVISVLFSLYVDYRWQEDFIVTYQLGEYFLGRVVDLFMGGGRSYFYF